MYHNVWYIPTCIEIDGPQLLQVTKFQKSARSFSIKSWIPLLGQWLVAIHHFSIRIFRSFLRIIPFRLKRFFLALTFDMVLGESWGGTRDLPVQTREEPMGLILCYWIGLWCPRPPPCQLDGVQVVLMVRTPNIWNSYCCIAVRARLLRVVQWTCQGLKMPWPPEATAAMNSVLSFTSLLVPGRPRSSHGYSPRMSKPELMWE